jgi:hypothetical protein
MTIGQIEKVVTLHELYEDYSAITPTNYTEHQKILVNETKLEIYANLLLKKEGNLFVYVPADSLTFVKSLTGKFRNDLIKGYQDFLLHTGLNSNAFLKSLRSLAPLLKEEGMMAMLNQNINQLTPQE